MSDLAELEKKQAEATKYALRMVEEKDPEKILEMAAKMQEKTGEIAKMAASIERAMTPTGGGPETVVVLTKDQRERIAKQTGVGIEQVTLRDTSDRVWAREMPSMEPRIIEKMAAKAAAESRMISETRDQVEKIIKQLEAVETDSPELKEAIAGLKKDPTLGLAEKAKKNK